MMKLQGSAALYFLQEETITFICFQPSRVGSAIFACKDMQSQMATNGTDDAHAAIGATPDSTLCIHCKSKVAETSYAMAV